MASKKRYEFQIFFNRAKNSAAKELQSPSPPLKRKVIFRRHSETAVILSYTNNHHKGEITGELYFSRGENLGDLPSKFARAYRMEGHNYSKSTMGVGFYIISRIFSILRLCSAPVVMM